MDVVIGHGAILTLAGNASLAQQTSGAVVLRGGSFELDNRSTNLRDRVRDAAASSTGIDSQGGGSFKLIGSAEGSTETIGRLQLGSPSFARSGTLAVSVVHTAGAVATTGLSTQSLSRDGLVATYAAVDFGGLDAQGKELPLGTSGSGPRILFLTAPPTANRLLRNTRNYDTSTVGWSTVNGSAFASYGPNGIVPVTPDPTPVGNTAGDPTANVDIRGNFTVASSSYAVNSLRLEPSADGQQLKLGGSLNTSAILLAGERNCTIAGGVLSPAYPIASACRPQCASFETNSEKVRPSETQEKAAPHIRKTAYDQGYQVHQSHAALIWSRELLKAPSNTRLVQPFSITPE